MTATAPTNIADLKNPPAVRQQQNVIAGFNDLHSFELMQRIAKMLSQSSLIPEIYRGAEGLPNAIVALNMAQRMNADPLMVCQNLYVVHGRPAWSAQFLIATFNRNGRYTSIRYRWQGTEGKDDWGCRAYATEIATGNEIVGPLVTIGLAKSEKWFERNGSKWKTIPELMLTYRAAAWMVRTNAPEIAMGLPTADEIDDVVTLTPEQYSVEKLREGAHARPESPEPKETENGKSPTKPDHPTVEFSEVALLIENATTRDQLDLARDQIRYVLGDVPQQDLRALADAKEKDLAK